MSTTPEVTWQTEPSFVSLSPNVETTRRLATGVGGLTSFGQAAFVGIAAYATGWLTTAQGLSPWLGLGVLATWLVVAYAFRYSSLSAIIAAIFAPMYAIVMFTSDVGVFRPQKF